MRFDDTIRNITSGDLGIPLLVTRLGVTGLTKVRVVYLLELFEGKRVKGQRDLVRAERLQMIRLMVVRFMSYLRVVSVVLALWLIGPILKNGYET